MEQLDRIEKMLSALLRQSGQLQVIDCWALGSNDGGRYISLFNSRAQFRLCAVYQEQWRKLPAYVVDAIDDEAPGDISTERVRVEKAKRLHACPAFAITRWQMGSGDDQAKWRFGDVLWFSQAQASPASSATTQRQPANNQPPVFACKADAIRWALAQGAFDAYDEAASAYDALRASVQPTNAGEMYSRWISEVRTQPAS